MRKYSKLFRSEISDDNDSQGSPTIQGSTDSKSMGSFGSCKVKGVKVVPLEESHTIKEDVGNETEDVSPLEEESELDVFGSYQDLLTTLNEEEDFRKRCEVVEQIRLLLKEDEEARMYMGANGFVEALLHFLSSALREAGCLAQESGAMALFNLAVNNNRNKEAMLASRVISLLEEIIPWS